MKKILQPMQIFNFPTVDMSSFFTRKSSDIKKEYYCNVNTHLATLRT